MKNKLFIVLLAAGVCAGLAGMVMAQAPAAPGAGQAPPTPAAGQPPATPGAGQAPAAAGAVQAPAAPASVKIGVINIQRAIIESNEGKEAAQKLQTQFAPKRQELDKLQADIDKLQKQYRDQEKTLSDEARTSLSRQIDAKTKEYNRARDDADSDYQQAEGQVVSELGQKVFKVLEEYAQKNGYQLVLDYSSQQSPVIYASNVIDVTDEIIKLYNASIPAAAPAPSATPPGAKAPATAPATKPPAAPPETKPPATAPETPPAAKPPGVKKQ
jgi:outer membrane protein